MDADLESLVGKREAILARIKRLLIEELHLRRAPEEIDPDAPLFGTGLGLDSVDAVELVVSLELAFGLKVAGDWTGKVHLRTVNALVDLVLSKPQEKAVSLDD